MWTGFTQRPFDLRDWEAEMAEFGLGGRVEHCLVDFEANPQRRRDAFAAGIERAEALRDRAERARRVVVRAGFRERRRREPGATVGKAGSGSITTFVVTPFPEQREDVWTELSAAVQGADRAGSASARRRCCSPRSIRQFRCRTSWPPAKSGGKTRGIATRARSGVGCATRQIDPNFDLFGTDERTADPEIRPSAPIARLFAATVPGSRTFYRPTRRVGSTDGSCWTMSRRFSINDRAGGSADTSGAT